MLVDRTKVKPYGDTLNDGAIQISFSLPIPYGDEAKEAAKILVTKMGIENVQVYHMKSLGENFTYFILYGNSLYDVDYTKLYVPKVQSDKLNFDEVNEFIHKYIRRKVTVVGACTGTDAHTVGIDAIMNMKGYNGEYGLERYPYIDAYNMGSQVENEEIIEKALLVNADVILVSQIVTQKGVHITNLTELIEILEGENLRDRFILICGGPRINHELALELGYDAGFGEGTLASEVASYFVKKIKTKLV